MGFRAGIKIHRRKSNGDDDDDNDVNSIKEERTLTMKRLRTSTIYLQGRMAARTSTTILSPTKIESDKAVLHDI